jgi:tetratricopeptide (TPR) repeat protein
MWKVVAAAVVLLVLACAGALLLGGYGGWEYLRVSSVAEEAAELERVAEEARAEEESRRDTACDEGKLAYAAKDYGRAIDQLDACVEASPGEAEPLLLRGKSYAQIDRLEAAEADIDRSLALDGASTDGWKTLSWVRVRLSDDRGAMDALDRWIALAPNEAAAYQSRADCAYRLGLVEVALRDATRACDLGEVEGCGLRDRIRGMGRGR